MERGKPLPWLSTRAAKGQTSPSVFVVAKSAMLRFALMGKTTPASLLLLSPQSLSTLRGPQLPLLASLPLQVSVVELQRLDNKIRFLPSGD